MGTHPKSPSKVLSSNKPLSEHLSSHPELMGKRIIDHFSAADGNLPFLFKVLAIEKALSIQTHPDKKTAEELHAQQPDIYKGTSYFLLTFSLCHVPKNLILDPNHKPEMALALTPFRALCGFLPLPQIATYLRTTPEFTALIPGSITNDFLAAAGSKTPTGPAEKVALKNLFAAVMTAEESEVKARLGELVKRYRGGGAKFADGETQNIVDLVLRLDGDFPGDIGVFCAFMLNYVSLNPGEAIFLGAGEPHAYVSGGTSIPSIHFPSIR